MRNRLAALVAAAVSAISLPTFANNGFEEPDLPGVALLTTANGLQCSATLVGPRHAVTLSTCVDGSAITLTFTGDDAVTPIHVDDASVARR